MSEQRTYVCPECGYAGFRAGKPTGPIDFNLAWFCPVCATNDRGHFQLVETSDPRTTA